MVYFRIVVIFLFFCDIGYLLFRKYMLYNVIIVRVLGEMIIVYISYMCRDGER